MASKKSISRAALKIIKGGTIDIKKALQEANKKLDKLQKENLLLKQQIKNLSRQSKKQRQTIKSQAGQLQAAQTKVQTLQKAVKIEKTQRIKAEKAAAKLKAAKSPKPKSFIDHLSKEQRRKFYQSTIYIPQLARRLQKYYGDKWKPEWSIDIIRVLHQLDPNTVNEIMVALDLEKIYFESEQYLGDAHIEWEAEYVYKTIMSYEG